MAQTTDPGNQVGSVGTTLKIIRLLGEFGGAGVTTVANELDIHKSTAYVHLNTLKHNGFVFNEDDTYHLSFRFLELGSYTLKESRLYEFAQPHVQELAADTNLLTNLMVEQGGLGVYLSSVSRNDSIKLHAQPGRHVHLHTTALGKALLAYLPDERVDEIIDRHGLPGTTDRTITDPDELHERLEVIREKGFAIDDEEHMRGVKCVALPIRDDNAVLGAMSISGPLRFVNQRSTTDLAEQLKDTVSLVELNLKYPD